MSEPGSCNACGAPVPSDSPDARLCPRCLMRQALERDRPTGTAPGDGEFEAPAPEELAAHFPDLEIQEPIGQGGMGCVYRARQVRLDRLVALKILSPRLARGEQFADRFTREARTLARVGHPNIVAIHDFGEAGGFHYLLMEYVDGANLREVLHDGRLTPREALEIVGQVCEAIQFAHDEGIVHRDIKPENILIDRKGRVRIADFGLAKILLPGREPDGLTGSGRMLGTPAYMAPEQIERPGTVDHRADIYSLGVVFYEMLTGELPLGHFAPPSSKVSLDVRLDQVVLRTLAKEPERRYQHASDVKKDVESIPEQRSPRESPPDEPPGRVPPPREPAGADDTPEAEDEEPRVWGYAVSRPAGVVLSSLYLFFGVGLGGPVLIVAGFPAVAIVLGLLRTAFGAPAVETLSAPNPTALVLFASAPIFGMLTILSIVVAVGLILLQNWARQIAIALLASGLAYGFVALFGLSSRMWMGIAGHLYGRLGVAAFAGLAAILLWTVLSASVLLYLRRAGTVELFTERRPGS